MKQIRALQNLYPGETLRVVGSGPSLAELTTNQIGPGPLVAINYAIRIVESLLLPNPVYSLQKDLPFAPGSSVPILAHLRESAQNGDFGDYVFDCEGDFGVPWDTPSIVVCLHLAKLFGCSSVEYWACDSFRGDLRSYDGERVTLDGRARHYAYHPHMVKAAAATLEINWSYV